ncbi:MAG: hypothetical protein H6719_34785 [Sandaracinaceae bacterium]|nr:hypothetical protein [Sandaracinaceae bacterium]
MHIGSYTAHARPSRHVLDQPKQVFAGDLPVRRCALPDRADEAVHQSGVRPRDEVGRVFASVDDVRDFCADHDAPRPYRVDYLGPGRALRGRRAAMCVYLLYVDPTYAGPTHYVLEAAMASGEAKVCYPPCEVGRWQTVSAEERPTPFATRQRVFRGRFEARADAPDEPGRLSVEVFRRPGDQAPTLRIVVGYSSAASDPVRSTRPPAWSRVLRDRAG